ncbi:cholesterol transport system auxiliary component [Rhodovulum imhoffii]|uniref:Cholesterol transport system auxiliary component n=1 Tax=Rhodovulum imhoffii TaxID=365340 RepID=A0A2T5BVJ2_9RHOB|nr:ABC-type transport auxiliary lipoprotein family protein [Rhodovulum imhoffii]PTN03601.1 cholesterol transport system auxiliary component [Rhodovulum imhoffii]
MRPLTLCLLLALPSCSMIEALDSASRPLDTYELRAVTAPPVSARRTLSRELVVERPGAGGALDTDRILVRPNPLEAQYLPGARWTNPAPEMLQTLLVHRLEASDGFTYVGRRPLGASGDYVLLSELTDLQAEIVPADGSVMARITLRARLIREDDASVIAQDRFSAEAQAASDKATDVVNALDAALSEITPRLTGWVLQRTGAGSRPGA